MGGCIPRQKLLNRFQETVNVIGIRVSIGLLGDVFAVAMQSKNRSVTLGAKDVDEFAFVLFGNRVSENKEIESCLLTLFNPFSEAERGSHDVTLPSKKHLACAQQRFVVRDGKNVRSHAFLRHGYEFPFGAFDFFLGLFRPSARSASSR